MASHDWRIEMENMLAAFNRQAIHSLTIIKSTFNRSNLSFTPEFKQYFMHASTSRINEAYDQFQVRSMFEVQLNTSLTSVANVANKSARNGSNGVKCGTNDRGNSTSIEDESDWRTNPSSPFILINDPVYNEVKMVTQNSSDPYDFNDGAIDTDGLHGINEAIDHQTNTNESYINDPDAGSDLNFDVELDESNIAHNKDDSTDNGDNELTPENVVFDYRTTTGSMLTKAKSKMMGVNDKNPHKKPKMKETNGGWSLTTKLKRSAPKKLVSRTQKSCTVCGYVTFHTGHLNQHMRTHTGEKPHRCDRCGIAFARATSLMIHAATHIAEFPFHCHACFQGFPSKTEMVAHEKRCKKRHYECHLCKKLVTFDKTELIKHMRKHSGVQPFRCEICAKRFSQKINMKQHLKTIHFGNRL